ncbi:MAG: hypothetical protein CME63_14435 [Halobacteriovoraceae bacterium]|jgi:hypothetical protein|nr:hypothetical protein [Halobacteriovoraceae bacterium]|tara:strand:+ start:8302 stop:9726 length:1425 start_codon:yes stop_codon:yes gene_type:complete
MLFVLLIFSVMTHGAPSGVIHELLQKVTAKSNAIKAVENLNLSNQLLLDSDLFIFEPTAFIRGSYSNQDIVPTSPFTPSNTKVKEYELGVSKLWSAGIQSDLSYLYQDSATIFPARANFVYQAPTLQLTLTTSIFQDLVNHRYRHLMKNQRLSKKAGELNTKIDKKAVIVQSLLDFSALLEQSQSLSLQKDICKQTRTQASHLERKRKRRSVSEREYLLGMKELTNCLATIDNLDKNLTEAKENFEATYNLSFDEFKGVDTDELFKEAEKLYLSSHAKAQDVDLKNQDEIKSLEIQIDALESKQAQLDAETKTNLALEVRSGLSGIGNSFSDANSDVTEMDYPFVYFGLRLDLPLKDRTALAQAGANRYQIKANRYQKDQLEKQKYFRFKTLEKTLAKDFDIYEKYKKTVSLSRAVIKEGRRDFANGRLDFNSLTEFNKSLIQDQKTLSTHRISLIVRVVEYLDFYQFFDHYLK